MAFKLRQPIKIDPVARYEVPFQPDNLEDKTGLVARANDNGNMIVNKNIPKDSKLRKVAESHEDNHLRAMMDGKLAYDEEAVYHNMDGKGMKKTSRSEFDESDRTTPWEAPAYKAGESMAKVDMRPKKDKLNRSSEVEAGKFAFAFREMNKPMRKQDQDTVSMSENFGTAMVKKFGIGPNSNDISGNPEGEKEIKAKAKSDAEAKLAKIANDGRTVDVDRPSIVSEKKPTWTDNYNSTTYVTESGKGIKRYSPKSNVVGGKVRYYDISKKNPSASMTEIDQSTFVDYLSKGDKATNQKYKKITEEDIVTGGDTETLKELRS